MTSRSERLLRLVALFCFGAVGVALISQHAFDMPPCAWCVMQRLIYLVIGVVALVGGLGGGRALTRVCGALAALLGLAGVVAAWYQYSVAAKMLSCDQTFADRFMSGAGLDAAVPWLVRHLRHLHGRGRVGAGRGIRAVEPGAVRGRAAAVLRAAFGRGRA